MRIRVWLLTGRNELPVNACPNCWIVYGQAFVLSFGRLQFSNGERAALPVLRT